MEYLAALFALTFVFALSFYIWLGTDKGRKWMVGDNNHVKN
jgi:hypothetical protein